MNEERLNQLLGRFLDDFGAVFHGAMVVIGDKLGLYKALAEAGPLSAKELADRTATTERYVSEWLASQAAGGYVTYDGASGRYSLTEEQAFTWPTRRARVLPGAFQLAVAAVKSEARIEQAFRSGEGVGWHEHDPELFRGTERFFRPGYAANLMTSWIPSLDGVEEKLKSGARVADVGCGHGASTILMAKAFPNSTFLGFDYHGRSIDYARRAASEAGVSDRATFDVAKAKDYPGRDYDLVTFFDCLHDMGDPVGASAHVLETLKPDGTWMLVEPYAEDRLENNMNPRGRAFYAASTLICTPASLSQEVGLGLGAQAGERGFARSSHGRVHRFRRATETPFNLVFEARP
jgi:2-polyprenyl-3-methyl-5-hydroxy-6-metoxy-1,4-benzoquinol methylase